MDVQQRTKCTCQHSAHSLIHPFTIFQAVLGLRALLAQEPTNLLDRIFLYLEVLFYPLTLEYSSTVSWHGIMLLCQHNLEEFFSSRWLSFFLFAKNYLFFSYHSSPVVLLGYVLVLIILHKIIFFEACFALSVCKISSFISSKLPNLYL